MNSTFFEGMTDEEKLAKLPQYIAIMQSMLKEAYKQHDPRSLYKVRLDDVNKYSHTCHIRAKDENEIFNSIRKILEKTSFEVGGGLHFIGDNTKFYGSDHLCSGGIGITISENRKNFLRLIRRLRKGDSTYSLQYLLKIEKEDDFDIVDDFITGKY